jgi:sulfoxide reductase heme-binding subunit YedZ
VSAATIAALSDRSLWYLSRGTGAVSLVLLTLALVLGIVDVRRWSSQAVPRFVIDGLHRTVSMVALLTLAIHIVTSVLDPFAPIRLLDAIVPFGSGYRPVWLGLGALAFDLLLALIVTSLVRDRIGYRGWRAVHWAAYACWPLALVHGLGTGSDVRDGFLLPLSLACAVAVAVAVFARLIAGAPGRPAVRLGGLGLVGAAGIALVVWLPSGPLAQGWAKRAGTPAAPRPRVARTAAPHGGGRRVAAPTAVVGTSSLAGRVSEGVRSSGAATANLALHLRHGSLRQLVVRLEGTALSGGGIALTQGRMTLGTTALPDRYSGPVDALEGNRVGGTLTASGTPPVRVTLTLQIDRASGAIGGQATISSTVTG